MTTHEVYVCEGCGREFTSESYARDHEADCRQHQEHAPILVWRFQDAPMKLQGLSRHGGDEDWLAVVPPYLKDAWIGWLDTGPFGCCSVSQHDQEDGSVVHIGAHA